jgi:D-inositol-3-phosphate glycosyltransferase
VHPIVTNTRFLNEQGFRMSDQFNRKTIVLLGSAWPLRGGLAAYNERLAREYMLQGHRVIVFGFSLQYPGFLFPGKSQYSTEPKPEGLDIRTRVNSVNPFNWFRTARAIRAENPDLMIVKYWLPFMAPCLGTIAKLVKRRRNLKVVAVVDNMVPHERRPGDRLFSKYFVRQVDAFVAMSQSVLEDISLFDQKKNRVLCMHPLYDHFGSIAPKVAAREALGIDPAGKWILFFGLIRDYKGLDILLRAMASDKVRNLGVKLLVAGEYYSDPTVYSHLIEVMKLEEHVVMHTEFIPDSLVARYFNAADMVVQPYKSATQSGVTQIAYHFHKPMVVTNVGGLPEMVPHGLVGYVVEPDHHAVAEAIADFYMHSREADFSAAVAQEKLKYTWRSLTDAIERLIQE